MQKTCSKLQTRAHGDFVCCPLTIRAAEFEVKMSRKVTIFSLATVELIRDLADQGKSSSEIAEIIGSTAASVRVRCSQLKIKLTPGRLRLPQTRPRHIPEPKLVLYMGPAIYAALKRKAAHIQKSPHQLAEALLEAVIKSDIYDAVLDEGE